MRGILTPSQNDVLSGKGKGMQNHHGNRTYRAIIAKWKPKYVQLGKTKDKVDVAYKVLNELKTLKPPAKFLTKLEDSDRWYPQDEAAVISKIKQALRENAPNVRKELHNEEKKNLHTKSTPDKERKHFSKSNMMIRARKSPETKTTNAGCNTPKKESPKGTKQTKEVSNKKVKTNNYEEVTSADWKKMIEELRNLSDESKDGKKKR